MPKVLKLLLLATFFNALAWIILVPIWQYPDEQAHFSQIQDTAELGKTPVGVDTSEEIAVSEKIFETERDGFGNNHYTYHPEFNIDYSDTDEGLFENYIESLDKSSRINLVKKEATHNPPLYYFSGSIFYKVFGWGDLFTRVYAVRFMSVVLFLATVFAAYKIASLIFKNKILQIVLPSLVAFKPMFVYTSTGILPDVLTNLLFTLIIYLSLRILLRGISKKIILKITIVVLFGVLTRQQFLICLPIVLTAIFYQLFKNRNQLQKYIFPTFLFFLAGILLTFLVPQLSYLRNLSLPEIGRPDLTFLLKKSFIDHLKISLNQTYTQTLPWYWGVYRWLSFTLPPFVYQIINRIVLIAFLGVILRIVISVLRRKITEFDKVLYFLIFSSFVYYVVLIIWDYYFRLYHGFSFGLQGRYFFPLVVVHLSIVLIGLIAVFEFIFKNYAKWGYLVLVASIIAFNDVSLFFVSSSYYSTSSINTFIEQASQYKLEIFRGNLLLFFILISLIVQIVFLFNLFKFILRNRSSV